jgi:MscS family membrane protein
MSTLYTQLFRLSGEHPALFWLGLLGLTALVAWIVGSLGSRAVNWLLRRLTSHRTDEFYDRVIYPQRQLLGSVLALGLLDIGLWLVLKRDLQVAWYPVIEVPVTLTLTLALGWCLIRGFRAYFDSYLLDAALRKGRKTNSELLVLGRVLAYFVIVVVLALSFGQTHNLNIVGLVASLGVGGIAVAFAAQKVLEQLLGGIVIYVDRPFGVDDYIGLADGTFGRVESIGLRSTKIRNSGKGTIAIVPNNIIIQSTVENFSGAKKVMAIVNLNVYRRVTDEEQALIRQVILDSTSDIFGIDPRSTDIAFRNLDGGRLTQVQITFFILGSGEVAMEIRRQLLDIASQKLTAQLKVYGISFELEEPTIYVDSPITV